MKYIINLKSRYKNNVKLAPYTALSFGILCIGLSAIFVKYANVPGNISAFYRFLIAGLILVPISFYRGFKITSKKDAMWALFAGAFFSLDLYCWNSSLLITSATVATLFVAIAPLWVGVLAMFIFSEKLSHLYWIGLFIALSGVVLILGYDLLTEINFNPGNLLAILASLCYSCYLLISQKARKTIDTLTYVSLTLISGILVLFIINLIIGELSIDYSSETWFSILGLGIITHLGGWISISFALGRLKAVSASVSLLGQVLITSVLSIILFNEVIEISQIIGGMLILTGIFIVNKK